ncbi:MAG: hypothetical protein QOG53_1416 [Frankiales bacterium]|jgi:Mg2+/citrate symporter|nr:hypothetical protein [Frankiales bacterium]
MIVLGLILLGGAAAATIGVVAWSQDTVGVQVFGHLLDPRDAGVVFVAGVIVGLVFALGVSMLMSGMARGRHRRKERRRIEKRRVAEQRELRERNAELEQKLAAERSDGSRPVDPNDAARRYAEH